MQAESARTLTGIAMFEGLDEADRRHLEGRCHWRHCAPGETVLERGGESQEVLFIVQGSVSIVNFSLSGREVAYATLGAGESFGELAAIDGQPRSASVVAKEKTLLASLPSDEFLSALATNGGSSGDRVEVKAGLREGDSIVIDPPERLADGDRVRVE